MTPAATPERYEVLRPLGRGGWAEVYAGRTLGLTDQLVALKFLRSEALDRPGGLERFVREAELGGSLNHPCVVGTRATDELDGRPFLVQELVGPSVDASRKSIEGDFNAIRRVARDLLLSLQYIHSHGIVHRDVTPANLLIDPSGRVRLIDFGIATRFDGSATPGPVGGTWPYCSPEMLRGERCNAATDVWSAGVTLIELATGDVPFGKTREEVKAGHRRGLPPLPRKLPRDLRRVIRGLLEMDAAARLRPDEALRMLRELDEATALPLAAVSQAWFRRVCPGERHPLDGRAAYAAAAEPPPRAPTSRWRVLVGPGLGAATTACAAAALWLVVEQRPPTPVASVTSSAGPLETAAELGHADRPRERTAPTRLVVQDGPQVEQVKVEPGAPTDDSVSGSERVNSDDAGNEPRPRDVREISEALRRHGGLRVLKLEKGALWLHPGEWRDDQLAIPFQLRGGTELSEAFMFSVNGRTLNVELNRGEGVMLVVGEHTWLAGREVRMIVYEKGDGQGHWVENIRVPNR